MNNPVAGFALNRRLDSHLDFLPAALEIQESPPSPIARSLVWTVVLLILIGVSWAVVGEVDIVVSAPGRIIPSGKVKLVQSVGSGTVTAIHIREGDRVAGGERLITLDPTYTDAESDRVSQLLSSTLEHISWRRAFAQWLAAGRSVVVPIELPGNVGGENAARIQSLYTQQRAEIEASLHSLEREKAAAKAGEVMTLAELDRAEATLVILKERVAAHQLLLEKQYGARASYLEMLQAQTELEKSIPMLEARSRQLSQSTAALEGRARSLISETRKRNLLELTRLATEAGGLTQELHKARQRQAEQAIVAPVDGIVEELAVNTVGGVVGPAQVLMKIVPEGASIEVEALVENRDIGFISIGQEAEVKVDAFNFTKYGLLDAKIADISNDAVENEIRGWNYRMRLELEHDSITVEDKLVRLTPGMSVTAEIKTGKRRLIEFFLSPLLRYKSESVRER